MAITARVLADSLAPCGARLTTMEWKYPRSVHSEIMTHRITSKNSASSRAIPVEKLIAQVVTDPFIPQYIGQKQSGMQAGAELAGQQREEAVASWLRARDNAVIEAKAMLACSAPKQIVNRLLEPWMWITIIISSTEWSNLYGLRNHKDAEPHFQHLAREAIAAMEASTPVQLAVGQWHLPLVYHDPDDIQMLDAMVEAGQLKFPEDFIKISVGRVARVSYLTHDGKRDVKEDIALHDKLVVQSPIHASPAEHIAQAMDFSKWFRESLTDQSTTVRDLLNEEGKLVAELYRVERSPWDVRFIALEKVRIVLREMQSGNFYGWRQYRKTLKNEHIGGYMP